VLAGCGSGRRPPAPLQPTATADDIALLNAILALEQRGIAAYTAAGPLLSDPLRRAAGRILSQELRHAGVLRSLVSQAGAKPRDPDAHYDLGQPNTAADLLALLHEVERGQIDSYLAAIPRVGDPATRQALASIMANDAQHVTVLRAGQGLSVLGPPLLSATE
jgi:rubrerythrin